MKKSEVLANLDKGHPVVLGQFLISKAERINYRDKVTKAPASMDKLTHTILTTLGVMFVEEDTRKLAAGFDPEKYVSPFKPNQPVAVLLSSMQSASGVITLRGAMHPVEP